MAKNKASEFSPMMKHYRELKEKYNDAILLYRLGDFYEMFFEDAEIASKTLDLTLTGRECGKEYRAPMCGVPHHAVDNYITRLLNAGFKVAICEQLSNPRDNKGVMVTRDVIRVITAGTNTNEEMLDNKQNHYLAGVAQNKNDFAVALLDITTGEFNVKEFPESDFDDIEDYLLSNAPSEIIADSDVCSLSKFSGAVMNEKLVKFTPFYDYSFDYDNAAKSLMKHFNVFALEALGLSDKTVAVCAAGAVMEYVISTQKRNLTHISKLNVRSDSDVMYIDFNTRKNLELTESQSDNRKMGSLLWVLDRTKTGMGARLLRNWLLNPLYNIESIETRQNAVGDFAKNIAVRTAVGNLLSKVRDVERLVTKISYGTIMPRDCKCLADSLRVIPSIKAVLSKCKSRLVEELNELLVELTEVTEKIDNAVMDAPPATFKDGNYIREGYSAELDRLRDLQAGGRELINKFESDQRMRTGVSALKVRNNRIFGYYIEIPNSKKPESLPFDYIRKQTVANGERYVNDELLRLERDILGATERIAVLEETLYSDLKEFLGNFTSRIQKTAQILANIDCLYSLAEVAVSNNYIKPKFLKTSGALKITDGRHPVVETLLKANEFVPNDTVMGGDASTLIITGPNMAGKSTYIRQVALLALMAHMGSFVPAAKMELGLIDRIFTRVGASDNLSRGQSTFMVEMLEVANILNNATEKSLLILDEIGRGTSTLDGLSIAWAIVEHIVLKIKAKTLFATHYHELSELENLLPAIRNYRILIQENTDGIVFLYKIARGGANKSFGIEVAAIAGVSKEVTDRARSILSKLSDSHELSGDLRNKLSGGFSETAIAGDQLSIFPEDTRFTELKKILESTDPNRLTPIEALTILNDMKKVMEK